MLSGSIRLDVPYMPLLVPTHPTHVEYISLSLHISTSYSTYGFHDIYLPPTTPHFRGTCHFLWHHIAFLDEHLSFTVYIRLQQYKSYGTYSPDDHVSVSHDTPSPLNGRNKSIDLIMAHICLSLHTFAFVDMMSRRVFRTRLWRRILWNPIHMVYISHVQIMRRGGGFETDDDCIGITKLTFRSTDRSSVTGTGNWVKILPLLDEWSFWY